MRKSGFTLIELLVVISIIGLLSSIVLASLSTARARARDTRRIEDLRQIQTALELYFSDYGKYPEPARGYGFWSGHCEGDFGNFDEYIIGLAPDYISVLPRDPKFDSEFQCYAYLSTETEYMFLVGYTMETIGANTADPSNSDYIRALARPCTLTLGCVLQPSIAVYTDGLARNW